MKKDKIRIERYIPRSLDAGRIIDVIQGYGLDNDSFAGDKSSDNTELWEIEIKVKKISEAPIVYATIPPGSKYLGVT